MTSLATGSVAWSERTDLDDLYHEHLPAVLARAARSPFYRSRWGRDVPTTVSDFEPLATTSKQDLRDAYPFGLLAVDRRDLATYHESSGTAGRPTASFYTERDWDDLVERYARKWVGIGPDDTFLVRTPYALMVTGHLAQAAARSRGATVVPGDNRSLATPCARIVRCLRELDVTLTWSMPTETLIWAAAARRRGLDPAVDFGSLRALFVGGEPMTPQRQERIAQIWGVPVVEEYGSTETGSLAGQCERGFLHLWADRALFEVADAATGQLSRTGVGSLVVTPLLREAMPLVRYDLADAVEVTDVPCDCGSGLPRVRVLGRSAMGYPVGGGTVRETDVERMVFELPAEYGVMFWRGRARPDTLELQIEAEAGTGREAADVLRGQVSDQLGVPVEVTASEPGALVPDEVLLESRDVVKPRSLFGPDESWGSAHVYF